VPPFIRLFSAILATAMALGCGTTQVSKPATESPAAPPESAKGSLTVTTQPAGVTVLVDGERVGMSPLRVAVLQGDRVVVLQHNGNNHGPHIVSVSDQPAKLHVDVKQAPRASGSTKSLATKRRKESSYRRQARKLGACFPDGWAGEDEDPESIRATAHLNDSGRLIRLKLQHPRATLEQERCAERILRPRYETRRHTPGIDRTNLTITIWLR